MLKCRKHGDEFAGKYPTVGVFIGLDIGVVIWSRGRSVTAWLGSGAGSVEQVEVGVRLRGDGEQIATSRSKGSRQRSAKRLYAGKKYKKTLLE